MIRFGSLVVLVAVLSGCNTMKYLPQDGQLAPQVGAPQALANLTGSVDASMNLAGGYASPGDRDDPSVLSAAELQTWIQEGEGIQVEIRKENTKDKGYATLFVYFLSLGILPSWITTSGETVLEVKSGDQVLFQNRESYQYKSALSVFSPSAMAFGSMNRQAVIQQLVTDQMNRHKMALGNHIAAAMADYNAAVAANNVETYRQFLKDNPNSFFRMETLNRLVALTPSRNAIDFHKTNLAIDPVYLSALPVGDGLWFIGPEGMRIHDVLSKSQTEDDVLLASRIKATAQPYKVFNDDEIQRLKAGGLSSTLIAAMIDVSAGAPAPVAAAAPAPAATQPALAAPAPGTVPPEGQADPTVGDIAAQCAKRYAALKACDQVPSFGANICRGQVKKKYSHLACSIIQ